MQHKRLVIDANILIRAVLGTRVQGLIFGAVDQVAFTLPQPITMRPSIILLNSLLRGDWRTSSGATRLKV